MKTLLALIVICLMVSCNSYEVDPTRVATYNRLMENMDLSCPEYNSEIYLKCIVDNTELCYFDGMDEREFTYGYATSFTTAGPTAETSIEGSDLKRRTRFSFKHPKFIEGEDYLEIWLPKMQADFDQITYFRNFFDKEQYNIKDPKDKDEDILIELRMLDRITETGGLGYDISCEYGDQEGSYLKVKHVEITEDKETVNFNFELEFECNLYHFYQFGREGLWSELTEGVLKAEITLNK